MSSSKKARATNQYTVHLLTQEGKAVGCGWEPPSTKALDLSPEDFRKELDSYAQEYSYPKEWHAKVIRTQGALSEGSLSSLSSGSDTLDLVDTESDMEKINGAALSQQQILLLAT